MNWKNIIKGGLICLSVCGFGELTFQVGKGRILGILSHYNITADTAKAMITDIHNHYPKNVIMSICDVTEEILSKKMEPFDSGSFLFHRLCCA